MADLTRPAIALKNVSKSFRKTARKHEYTTFKTEFIRLLTGQRKVLEPSTHIEALKRIDLTIERGKTVGIVGRNGSGKSTLLKLMTGIYSPTGGTIEVHGRVSALLELGAGFHPDFTGRENIVINGIILGMSRSDVKARVDDIIEYAELGEYIDEPVRTYSSGMFMRLAFAVATHVDPEILIIDEILSVGDEHFSRKSYAKMNEFRYGGKTIVLVTHDLTTVEKWCDAAAWIDGGTIRLFDEPKHVVAEYRRAISAAEAQAQETGHSALSAPGLALPQTPPAAHASQAPARVSAVRIRDTAGRDVQVVSPQAALEVVFDFEAPVQRLLTFSVEFVTAEGQLVFGTTHGLQSAGVPAALHVSFPHLGLGEGLYDVVVTATAPGHQATAPQRARIVVGSEPGTKGLARPLHTWRLAGPLVGQLSPDERGAAGAPVRPNEGQPS